MLIVQVSDVHLVKSGLLYGNIDAGAHLDQVLARVAQSGIHPDLVLCSGDLADDGAPESYRALRKAVDTFATEMGATVCYLPGNHDDRVVFRVELLDQPDWIDPTEPIDQVLNLRGVRVIALDSVVPGEKYGALSDEQLDWLAAELDEPAPEGTLLALHHPPVPTPIELMARIALREPERLAAVVEGSDVRIITAGHNHHAMTSMFAGVPVFVCPATSYLADVLIGPGLFRSLPGVAFGRIDLDPDGGVCATGVPVGTESQAYATVSSHDLGLD